MADINNKKSETAKAGKSEYIWAVGRRKRAVARVRLYPKTATKDQAVDIMVNDKPVGQYFQDPTDRHKYAQPLSLTNTLGKYHITVKVTGSGVKSQLCAVLHGISRALVKVDIVHKSALRQAGLITRDPRERQKRMIGRGGKSRAQKQSPKR